MSKYNLNLISDIYDKYFYKKNITYLTYIVKKLKIEKLIVWYV